MQTRKHPLFLLSGVATNAVGYDLCPKSSFARFMSGQGFDTWVLELRGSGLSTFRVGIGEDSDASLGESKGRLEQRPSESFMNGADRLSSFFDDGVSSQIGSQIRNLSQKLLDVIEGSQQFVSPNVGLFQGLFPSELEDVIKQLDMVSKYDWDLDHHLEEDLPSAVEYIRTQSKPNDGQIFAIGHSMGGILLYAMLSRSCSQGRDSGLTSIVTLGSTLDYTPSNSSLKFLLPVADPARALNIPAIPVGTLIAAAYHFSSSPPYVLSWLKAQVTAQGMLHPQALTKLVSNSFCTVPAKLLLQLTTAFQQGGLTDRSGNFLYKQHLKKSKVPVLAIAGDQDFICPPTAVYETVKSIPEHLVMYKVFGEPGGPHYGHYDLVGGRWVRTDLLGFLLDAYNLMKQIHNNFLKEPFSFSFSMNL
ncbi:unnamed protein product [Linum tenue]|uniref:AB hydrolase-1 domain-containing protein n=1 Tax=Linum tenue TaxID=586396 RepID=A0AAV0LAY4_9ROSI|nr:unnamed protein product [Linum tenue]